MSSRRQWTAILCAGALASVAGAKAAAQQAIAAPAGDIAASHVDLSATQAAIKQIYDVPGAMLWTAQSEAALRSALSAAPAHGLDPSPYLSLIDASRSPEGRDMNLTRAALAYAKALSEGLVDPAKLFAIYTIPGDRPDLAGDLRAALQDGKVASWLAGLAPRDQTYLALSAQYGRMVAQSETPPAAPISGGALIRVGDTDPRAPQIRAALSQDGFADDASAGDMNWKDSDAAVLKRYQRSHGLAEDGVVGPDTLAVLNATPQEKARRLAVNLERLRWLQRSAPATRIDVNIAASTLTYVQDGKEVWTTRVVTGRPGHETPQIQASFDRLVVNPPWHVPASIAQAEILPKGAAYMRRSHMRWVSGRVVQSPGPWAALGQVKFDLEDPYAIYLHDTPAKGLFDLNQRHLSHGCVRVEDAVAFARRLAEESGEEPRFDRILQSGATGVAPLSRSIPVRLIYQTAVVGEDGSVTLLPDVYGWDAKVADAMGLKPPPQGGFGPAKTTIGP